MAVSCRFHIVRMLRVIYLAGQPFLVALVLLSFVLLLAFLQTYSLYHLLSHYTAY